MIFSSIQNLFNFEVFYWRCYMLDNFFKFSENNTDVKTEIIAGITTFLAMSYILGVNPGMLAEGGMPATGVFFATALHPVFLV